MVPADPALTPCAPLTAPTAATSGAQAVIEGQVAMLTRLAQIGMEIAEACGREAQTGAAAGEHPRDPALAFARVARAVRMTIALQSRLLKDLAGLGREDADARAALKDARRIRLSRLVEQAAEATVTARRDAAQTMRASWNGDSLEDEIEALATEAYERLTDAEDDAEFDDRPFEQVVAAICADLGLAPDWTARLLAAAGPSPAPASAGPPGGAHGPRQQDWAANPPDLDPDRRTGPQRGPGPNLHDGPSLLPLGEVPPAGRG